MVSTRTPRLVSAEEAVAAIQPGSRVRFPVGQVPLAVADQLAARAGQLTDVELVHTAAIGPFPWFSAGFEPSFTVVQEHWASPINWPMMKSRQFDYMPMPFSLRFKAERDGRSEGRRHVDVVCVQTSPPDERGMVNLGRAIWDAPEYMRRADLVIAEVVPDMPILCGDGELPADLATYFVEEGTPVTYAMGTEITDVYRRLAENMASIISDGDTLQIGAGTASKVSAPFFHLLADRNDLGWHSETTQLGVPSLIRSGVMTSRRTSAHPGVAISSSWPVPEEHREFMERNPAIEGREIWKVADPRAVASIDNFRAINSVMMVDLTGQAAAESVGTEMRSGTGGLIEFMIGSLWSNGGSSLLVLTATDASGERSRILPNFIEGTQVTVPRTLVDMVATEYGVARLWGKTARERAAELTRIAAPQFRDELEAAARRLFYP